MSSSFRRKVCVLLLAAVLLVPWTVVAEPSTRAEQHGTLASWDLLSRLWAAVAAFWGNSGCSVDPFGECGATSVSPEGTENLNNGCGMDPYGECRSGNTIPEPTSNRDNGCSMDPNGVCGSGG